MKELSIEEKARRYDEALKVAKGLYAKDAPDSLHLERMFPELKESEDEATWLKKYVEEEISCLSIDVRDDDDRIKLENLKRSLAWLEKQGEKIFDPRYSIVDKLIEADDIYQMAMNNAMAEEAKNKAIDALSDLEISKVLGIKSWNEEDYKMFDKVIEDIEKLAGPYVCYRKDVEFIKSLKVRAGFEAG